MKTQSWGWLAAAVLAAGLNSSYHNGGLQWAHEIADRVQHNSSAVLALATGRADKFLAEARMLNADSSADTAVDVDTDRVEVADASDSGGASCPFSRAMARVQRTWDRSQAKFDRFQAISNREQARLDRIEANRNRIETEVRDRLSRVHFQTADFTPVTVELPEVKCPRVRVSLPRAPRIKVPAPDVHVEFSGPGPV